jgi:hypothetical protein
LSAKTLFCLPYITFDFDFDFDFDFEFDFFHLHLRSSTMASTMGFPMATNVTIYGFKITGKMKQAYIAALASGQVCTYPLSLRWPSERNL